ncbi:MAG: polysaccharide biosynthesis C-terminal domain-containing protein [Bacteroidota bacterium]
MELKKIIKSTSYLVSSKVVQFLLGLVKSKIGAVYLGTTGIGIFNQVNYLTNMISQVTLLSMNDGLVKQIAQNREEAGFREILKGLIRSYANLIIFSVLLAFVVCLVFARPLTIFFLGDYQYLTYYLFGVASVPILIMNSLSFALLKSHKATKEISRANITSAVISLCFFIPLVYFFRITGAVISVTINFILILYINNYQARKFVLKQTGIRFRELLSVKPEKKYSRELLKFALFGATSGLIYVGAESVCRSLVVNQIGIDRLGVYSPIIAWSGLLTGFILPAVQVYLFPRYSECKSNTEISAVLNDYLYLITFLLIPFVLLAIPFRELLIRIFYSNEFLEAATYLPWHFIGLMFFMWWNVLALVLTPIGKIKVHGILLTLISIVNVGTVFFLVPRIGLYGWMLKFIVSPVLFSGVYLLYLRSRIRVSINRKNILLMSYSVAAALLLIVFDHSFVRYILSPVLIAAAVLFLSGHEKEMVLNRLRKFIPGNKTIEKNLPGEEEEQI